MRRTIIVLTFVAALAATSRTPLWAQIPTPPPPSPTLWSFLGIPQTGQTLNAQLFNRRGNFPGLEAKPQLLHLADPKNLESPVEAIKAAAEIKQAEDLAPQKIKAIKYLASIGCGCYDKEKKITKALIAGMTDCTEDVRLEAVEAIEEAASGECCANCSQRNCCGEDVSEMLAQIAYELDENGCYFEPSERVREAAMSALSVCCPNVGAPPYTEPLPVEGTLETPSIEGAEPSEEALPNPDTGTDNQEAFRPRATPLPSRPASSRRTARLLNSTTTDVQPQQASRSSEPSEPSIAMVVDPEQNIAKVRFRGAERPMRGERLKVWSSTDYGYRLAGKLEVFAVYGQTALVRPLSNLELATLSPGTMVVRSQD